MRHNTMSLEPGERARSMLASHTCSERCPLTTVARACLPLLPLWVLAGWFLPNLGVAARVLLGNWNEDKCVEETILKDFLAKKEGGCLKIDR